MMNPRTCTALLLVAALAACERNSQTLPFDAQASVARTVDASGAVVSSSAGATVQIPAGAVASGTTVTLTPTPPPAAVQQSGTPVSTAFQLEPAGLELQRSARVEVRFDAARLDSAWLASVTNVTPTGIRESGDTRVDLTTGRVETRFRRFGTLAVVIPERSAIFKVQRSGSLAGAPVSSVSSAGIAASHGGTDSVSVNCGDPSNRCTGLSVTASQNLLDRVEDAAVVYPMINGALRVNGTGASGAINLEASLRARLRSGATAENVLVNARVEPTASTTVSETGGTIRFTNLRFVISGDTESGSVAHEQVQDLVIATDGTGTVTITRTFQISGDSGGLEDASVTLSFPVQIHS